MARRATTEAEETKKKTTASKTTKAASKKATEEVKEEKKTSKPKKDTKEDEEPVVVATVDDMDITEEEAEELIEQEELETNGHDIYTKDWFKEKGALKKKSFNGQKRTIYHSDDVDLSPEERYNQETLFFSEKMSAGKRGRIRLMITRAVERPLSDRPGAPDDSVFACMLIDEENEIVPTEHQIFLPTLVAWNFKPENYQGPDAKKHLRGDKRALEGAIVTVCVTAMLKNGIVIVNRLLANEAINEYNWGKKNRKGIIDEDAEVKLQILAVRDRQIWVTKGGADGVIDLADLDTKYIPDLKEEKIFKQNKTINSKILEVEKIEKPIGDNTYHLVEIKASRKEFLVAHQPNYTEFYKIGDEGIGVVGNSYNGKRFVLMDGRLNVLCEAPTTEEIYPGDKVRIRLKQFYPDTKMFTGMIYN